MSLPSVLTGLVEKLDATVRSQTQAQGASTAAALLKNADVLDFSLAALIRLVNRGVDNIEKFRVSIIQTGVAFANVKHLDELKGQNPNLYLDLFRVDELIDLLFKFNDSVFLDVDQFQIYEGLDTIEVTLSKKSTESGRTVRRLKARVMEADRRLKYPTMRLRNEATRVSRILSDYRIWIEKSTSEQEKPVFFALKQDVELDRDEIRKGIMQRYANTLSYLAK